MEYTEPPIEPDLWDDIDRDERTTCRHCGTLGEDTGDECPRCERNRDTGRRIEDRCRECSLSSGRHAFDCSYHVRAEANA